MDSFSSHCLRPRAAGALPARWLRESACRGILPRLLVGALMLLAANTVHAQGAATDAGQARGEAVPPQRGLADDLGKWPGIIRSALQDALTPVLLSLKDFVRPARNGASGWGDPPPSEGLPADTAVSWPNLGRATGDAAADAGAFTLQPPTLSLGYAGVGPGVGFTRFRIPWLLTPESAMRAMPTLTLGGPGSLRLELVAGSVGGRNGASAAYGQLVFHF